MRLAKYINHIKQITRHRNSKGLIHYYNTYEQTILRRETTTYKGSDRLTSLLTLPDNSLNL